MIPICALFYLMGLIFLTVSVRIISREVTLYGWLVLILWPIYFLGFLIKNLYQTVRDQLHS